jgi:alkylation response protein AidB-like acyl-CoA dehydrogenase
MQALSAQTASADDVAEFLGQVNAVIRDRTAGADPWHELDLLGLLPGGRDDQPWDALDQAAWFCLLRGVAQACPCLAIALSSARLIDISGGDARTMGWAHNARRNDGAHWQLVLAVAPQTLTSWLFLDGLRLRCVDAARLQRATSHPPVYQSSCADPDCKVVGNAPDLARLEAHTDVPLLLAGALRRLWELAAQHAETRPMFRRHLADFPVIQLRLLASMVEVMRAEQIALGLARNPARCFALGHASALRRKAQAVCIETQQICGGTGYMRNSAFAQTLAWIDWCDGARNLAPVGDAALSVYELADIDAGVMRQLTALGMPADQVSALLQLT